MQEAPSRVHFDRSGPRGGPPVVLIHAVGFDHTFWHAQVAALQTTHDVIAMDLPGHGLSPGRAEDVSFDYLADSVADVITATGASQAHVIGVSLGGMVAQTVALAYPRLVRSLVLLGTTCTFSPETRQLLVSRGDTTREKGIRPLLQSLLDEWYTPETLATRPDVADRATQRLLKDDQVFQAAMWHTMSTLDVKAQLDRITCPTLIFVGAQDKITPVAASQAIADRIAGSEMHIVQRAAHMVETEAPDEINSLIKSFLQRI